MMHWHHWPTVNPTKLENTRVIKGKVKPLWRPEERKLRIAPVERLQGDPFEGMDIERWWANFLTK